MNSNQPHEYKIPFVGNSSVGKTSIISRFSQSKYSDQTTPTIGASNFHFTVNLESRNVILNVWDTAGQERFRSLVPLYTRGAHLIVMVCDISEPESFAEINSWYNKLRVDLEVKCPIVLVANKMDLEPIVAVSDVKKWGADHDVECFFTSAAQNQNISTLFESIALVVSAEKPVDMEHVNVDTEKNKKKCC